MANPTETWHDLLQETATYLAILHAGGFCCVDGTFESLAAKPKRPARPEARRAPAGQSPLSSEQRDQLKAALMDPYAHMAAPARSAPSGPPEPKRRPARAAAKAPQLELRDCDEGLRRIKAAKSLDEIRTLVAGCYMCGLSAGRPNTVPGEGNPDADLVFIGEAPGFNEDKQGRPFVGRAGDLLTEMIHQIGFRREDVFIGNIIKCRPPGNRDPNPNEIKACEPFLQRQLEILRPKVICALGRIAIQSLLRNTRPISRVRGQWQSYNGIPLMPTYHPAYLLRNASQKQTTLGDFRAAVDKLKAL